MDALFAKSTTKAAWAQIRRKPLPLDAVGSTPIDMEKDIGDAEKDNVSTYEVKADDEPGRKA